MIKNTIILKLQVWYAVGRDWLEKRRAAAAARFRAWRVWAGTCLITGCVGDVQLFRLSAVVDRRLVVKTLDDVIEHASSQMLAGLGANLANNGYIERRVDKISPTEYRIGMSVFCLMRRKGIKQEVKS